jgi:hypothetical protein
VPNNPTNAIGKNCALGFLNKTGETVIEPPQTSWIRFKLPIKDGFIFACMAKTMLLTFKNQSQEDLSTGFKADLNKACRINALSLTSI